MVLRDASGACTRFGLGWLGEPGARLQQLLHRQRELRVLRLRELTMADDNMKSHREQHLRDRAKCAGCGREVVGYDPPPTGTGVPCCSAECSRIIEERACRTRRPATHSIDSA